MYFEKLIDAFVNPKPGFTIQPIGYPNPVTGIVTGLMQNLNDPKDIWNVQLDHGLWYAVEIKC